jgi:ADP-ribose pyrophosphatase YjhB (NUDIX family)
VLHETTILHGDVDPAAQRLVRLSTRAVARRGDDVLLLRGAAGDLRFPGGGVDAGEDAEAALRRELDEECGARLLAVGDHWLTVVDERPAREPGCVFAHVSQFWDVEVEEGLGAAAHDARERALGLVAGWVALEAALSTNRRLREARRSEGYRPRPDTAAEPDPLAWIERETLALELLADR